VVLDRDYGGTTPGPLQDRRVHDRVQVDHVGAEGRHESREVNGNACPRLEPRSDRHGTGRLHTPLVGAHHEVDRVAEGHESVQDAQQMPVGPAAVRETVGEMQDAHGG
jgi:hypothetical protein